jgi:hypothetical protein
MFVDVIPVHMVEMAVVKIIHMALMANRGVPAFGPWLCVWLAWCFSVHVAIGAAPCERLVAHRCPTIPIQ